MKTNIETAGISTFLTNRRLQLGLSKTATAKLAHISASYYGAIEREDAVPTSQTLEKILVALHFDQNGSRRLRELVPTRERTTDRG